MGYDFDISYQPSKSNIVADALSRQFQLSDSCSAISSQFQAISMLSLQFLFQLRAEVESNPFYENLLDNHSNLFIQFSNLRIASSIDNRICIYSNWQIIPHILFEFHNTPVAGHGEVHKTLTQIVPSFYWENMRKDVQSYVANYAIFQQTKYSAQKPQGQKTLSIPAGVWEDISIDLLPVYHLWMGFRWSWWWLIGCQNLLILVCLSLGSRQQW